VKSEWEWLARAQRGSDEAWRFLREQHQARLFALAMFIVGSPEVADDVVQETFVRALGATIKDNRGTVQGYLGTIAYRLAVKEARRGQRNVKLDGLGLRDRSPDPLESLLDNERDRLVAEAIGDLNEEHRTVLVLRCYGCQSYEEIAKLLQVPLGTVKSRVFYAVKACREALRHKGVL